MELLAYFDVHYAVQIHDQIINISGGRFGVLDLGRLESILVHVQNDLYYPDFGDKLTHLVFQINKGHCFNDGNKRTSIALGAFFLEINGLGSLANHFIIQMENVSVAVADNLIPRELLREIIESLLTEPDYNESLKLKIIAALSIDYNGLTTDETTENSNF